MHGGLEEYYHFNKIKIRDFNLPKNRNLPKRKSLLVIPKLITSEIIEKIIKNILLKEKEYLYIYYSDKFTKLIYKIIENELNIKKYYEQLDYYLAYIQNRDFKKTKKLEEDLLTFWGEFELEEGSKLTSIEPWAYMLLKVLIVDLENSTNSRNFVLFPCLRGFNSKGELINFNVVNKNKEIRHETKSLNTNKYISKCWDIIRMYLKDIIAEYKSIFKQQDPYLSKIEFSIQFKSVKNNKNISKIEDTFQITKHDIQIERDLLQAIKKYE